MDRRCDLWLEFENGTKLAVEMIDHREAQIEEIPLHDPPKKVETEILVTEGDRPKDGQILATESDNLSPMMKESEPNK